MEYTKINLMIPTYKRTESFFRLVNSAYRTAFCPDNLRITLCVNERDYDTVRFIRDCSLFSPLTTYIVFERSKQPNLAMYFNMMFEQTPFNDPDTLVSMIGDDMEFLTPGWDESILRVINVTNGQAVVYCNDNFTAHESCAVNLFTTRDVVVATEKPFMCTRYAAEMIDVVWTWVGQMTKTLHYLPNVLIEHHHGSSPVVKEDETYERLKPIRKISNQKEQYKWGKAYATVCAGNLIKNGVGQWNVLNVPN